MTPAERIQGLQEEAKKLQAEAQNKFDEADKLALLAQQFPDLGVHFGRWNKLAYYSKTANPHATHYDLRYNCGCCPDSPLELWPYMIIGEDRVYSDPPCILIGEREAHGARPCPGWVTKLKEANMPEELIQSIKEYFRKEKQEALEQLEAAMSDDDT